MSGKPHVLSVVSALAGAAISLAAIAGCSSNTTTSPNTESGTRTPVATSSGSATVKEEATACVDKTGVSQLITSSGRSQVIDCLKGIVPPAEQQAFTNCVSSAAINDRIWTSEGRTKFTGTSVPNCVNQVG